MRKQLVRSFARTQCYQVCMRACEATATRHQSLTAIALSIRARSRRSYTQRISIAGDNFIDEDNEPARPLREQLDFRHDALDRDGNFGEEDEEAIMEHFRQREREVNYGARTPRTWRPLRFVARSKQVVAGDMSARGCPLRAQAVSCGCESLFVSQCRPEGVV